MKLKNVHFVHPVNFHGTITSANSHAASDPMRAGATPFMLDLGEYGGFPGVRISKQHNNVEVSTIVPMTNVANFTLLAEEPKQPAKK